MTRASLGRIVIVALVWALASGPAPGNAQERSAPESSAPETAEAIAWRAQEAYREGRFEEAADLFGQSYASAGAPVLLYNQARAYENAAMLDQAIDAYGRYLEAEPTASDRAGIVERVRRLRDQRDERERLRRESELLQEQLASQEPEPDAEAPPPSAPRLDEGALVAGWTLAALGAVGLGVATGLGVHAADLDAAARATRVQADAGRAAHERDDFALAANVTFAAAGVTALVGAVLGVVALLTPGERGWALDARGLRVSF